ncbi:HEAT repeat domain-containing protein [Bradyrhizobium liaoningense]|uniref:HEAT repeat domain-containing protein n=1 Tax=Bradyrhizobium liaoningense TaxID=43992 RepID=UPI0039088BA9
MENHDLIIGRLGSARKDGSRFIRSWCPRPHGLHARPPVTTCAASRPLELGNELALVRSLAAWHLGRLGPVFPGIEQALHPLRQLAGDEDPSVRVEAALALVMLEGKGAPPPELKSLCT